MVHSDSDLILHNSSVLIDKEPFSFEKTVKSQFLLSFNNVCCLRATLTIFNIVRHCLAFF
ncbi:hypothetical protein EXW01_11790 [Enterococcus faecium]|nr:hypothetical protein [Enterococcus faecium]MDN6960193.1 hypothetical protein [Enterococcus faecium]MDO7965910.1 hypothetical protein [Enterococcus faecium]MDO8007871.1 hypothetical protein [Enterococcus faecium]